MHTLQCVYNSFDTQHRRYSSLTVRNFCMQCAASVDSFRTKSTLLVQRGLVDVVAADGDVEAAAGGDAGAAAELVLISHIV